MKLHIANLTLGTAAFGATYGISNPEQPVCSAALTKILDRAWDAGIRSVDTAPAYGEAERKLGDWMRTTRRKFAVISKLPLLREYVDAGQVIRCVEKSRKNLGVDCIEGYLAHRPSDLYLPGVADAMRSLRNDGRISAFGASVYTTKEAELALDVVGLSMLQVPLNLFDHRMIESGILSRCQRAGISVFARSIFLQGAFFMNPAKLPPPLQPLSVALAGIAKLATQSGYSISALALAFARDEPGVVSSVVGVYDMNQLKELIASHSVPPIPPEIMDLIRTLACGISREVIDPRKWH